MKVRASATKRPWTRAATKRTRRRSPPPSVRDPAIAVASGGDAAWRTFGERMLELERQEWRSRAFSRAEMRRQVAAGRPPGGPPRAEGRLARFAVATPGRLARCA